MERAVYLQAKHLQARGVDTVLVTRPATRDGARFPGEVVTVPYGSRRIGAHGRVLDRIVHYPRLLRAGRRGGGARWCASGRSTSSTRRG